MRHDTQGGRGSAGSKNNTYSPFNLLFIFAALLSIWTHTNCRSDQTKQGKAMVYFASKYFWVCALQHGKTLSFLVWIGHCYHFILVSTKRKYLSDVCDVLWLVWCTERYHNPPHLYSSTINCYLLWLQNLSGTLSARSFGGEFKMLADCENDKITMKILRWDIYS